MSGGESHPEPLVGPVVLIGPPGAGKSTVGALAARRLGLPFLDLDDEIARAAGSSVDELFVAEGETSFRVREAAALHAALDGRNVVIAAGAGVVDAAPNRTALARAHVIWLDVDDDTALLRLAGARPWLPADREEQRTAYRLREARRRALRATLAAARVDGRAAPDVAAAALSDVVAALPLPVAEWRGDALAEPRVVERAAAEPSGLVAGGLALIDDGVPQAVPGVRLPGGERSKTTAGLERVLRVLHASYGRARARQDAEPIVAVGGGAFLDVVGTAAALWRRGTPWIAVPTTPLAMADAALGGKTALDLDDTKNALGAFHAPDETQLWLGFLASASAVQLADGQAEALKHAWLTGTPLEDKAEPARWVRRSLAIKAGVVARDPRERGLRRALNLGHTVGHALERVHGLSHGEAVRRGLLATLWLSEELLGLDRAVSSWLRPTVAALGPLPPFALDAERAQQALSRDKKGGRFVLLAALGRPVLVTPPAALVPEALAVAARGTELPP
ncbi:MAG: bifunctional shikimate kinase/3-dehydroquinate synthase [Deltaproteobacteria bacterium]|nr:bifunctional shikimate kinase/3-dehydroquinate synthase [Deltaproteobacteria bacterium]